MSDINNQPGAEAQPQPAAPHIEPVGGGPVGGAPADSDFEKELSAFLGHSMMDETPDGDPITLDPGEGQSPTPAPATVPGNATQVASDNAPLAGNLTGAPTVDTVDPALVVEMLGFGKDNPQGTQPPAAAPVADPAAPPAPTDENAPFTPFRPDFTLPPQMTQALFEAEDSETRSKALVGLISSAMNAAVQVMEERIKTFHAPKIAEGFQAHQVVRQQQDSFVADFYDEKVGFPDLRQYGSVVKRAIEVLSAQNPNISWAEAKPRVAALARQAVASMTGQPVKVPTPAVPKAAPPARAQDTAFLAVGARPAGAGDPVDPNSPSAILTDMTAF